MWEWLLLRMYMDFLQNGWAVWDEEYRENYKGRSLPPIGVMFDQFLVAVMIHAARARREG